MSQGKCGVWKENVSKYSTHFVYDMRIALTISGLICPPPHPPTLPYCANAKETGNHNP